MYLVNALCLLLMIGNGRYVKGDKICKTDICRQYVQEINSSIDEETNPCEDFSSYICGNYDKTHPIPKGSSSSTAMTNIGDKVTGILRNILENQPISDVNVPQTKAALFYRSCMNQTHRDLTSKQVILNAIKEYGDKSSFIDALVAITRKGITGRIVYFQVTPDAKNPEYYQLFIGKADFILSEATLKSPDNPNSKKQIFGQLKFMKRVLSLLGLEKEENEKVLNDVIALNIELAKLLPSVADQNNPDKFYNKITVKELQIISPELPWMELINRVLAGTGKSVNETDQILISSIPFFKGISKVIKKYLSDENLKKVLFYDLFWAELSSVVTLASTDLLEADQEYIKDLIGVTGRKELWKRCVELTSSTFNEIVGNMYVKKNFDASKKKDIENMLVNIRNALKEVIKNVNWMDQDTKLRALEKLKTIKQKIGYSNSILNETALTIDHIEVKVTEESLISNFYSMKQVAFKDSISKVFEKISDDAWSLGPHQVNAYYNAAANEIVFPAAILQYPFYDIGLPVTSNYGGIGFVIGHEIIHGFDTSGSKFDEKGYLRNWWTAETKSKYLEKTQCLENQYANYSIYNETLPSEQTIEEDIADNAGIRMAYIAVMSSKAEKLRMEGLSFTAEQLFFVHEARMWCSHVLKDALLDRMKSDEHSVWKFRINGPLSNMPEFSKAFKCHHDQKMNRHKKCLVW